MSLLDDAERSLLETVAVFVDGWTIDAAAHVAGLDEGRALELTEALARHSLIQLDSTDHGPRPRMLETVRAFVAERLAARADAADIQRRHADHHRALAEGADRNLRGVEHSEWLQRLEAEAGNLAAAVDWYLGHDRGPLPHLVRVLWLFWELRDRLGQARAWVEPAGSSASGWSGSGCCRRWSPHVQRGPAGAGRLVPDQRGDRGGAAGRGWAAGCPASSRRPTSAASSNWPTCARSTPTPPACGASTSLRSTPAAETCATTGNWSQVFHRTDHLLRMAAGQEESR